MAEASLKRRLSSEDGDAKKLKTADSGSESGSEDVTSTQQDATSETEGESSDKKDLKNEEESKEESEEETKKVEEPLATKIEELKPKVVESKPPVDNKPVFGAASTFGNKSMFDTMKSKPSIFDTPSLAKSSFGSFGSFGSNSKFGNAFENSLHKKSFLDEPKEEEDAPKAAINSQQYKQVDLLATEVKTGEENEKSCYSVTAKLFELDFTKISEGWKERGVGPLHLNQSLVDLQQVRLVMRSQGLLRVVLNYKISPTTVLIKGFEASMSPGKFLRLNAVSSSGEPLQYMLKFGSETVRDELIEKVEELKKETEKTTETTLPKDSE